MERKDWENWSNNKGNSHIDDWLGQIKRDDFLRFFKKHAQGLHNKTILKTDLREEGGGSDHLLFCQDFSRAKCLGVDVSFAATQRAVAEKLRLNYLNQFYINADVRRLPIQDGTVDLVISTSTLDHFSDRKDFKRSLSEIKRVLKPGGRAIISVNNRKNMNFYLMLKIEKLFRRISFPVDFFTLGQIEKVCAQIDMELIAHDYIVNIVSPVNSVLILMRKIFGRKGADAVGRFCVRFAERLARSRFKDTTAWFIVFCLRKSESA